MDRGKDAICSMFGIFLSYVREAHVGHNFEKEVQMPRSKSVKLRWSDVEKKGGKLVWLLRWMFKVVRLLASMFNAVDKLWGFISDIF
jgi:hypothetical protein